MQSPVIVLFSLILESLYGAVRDVDTAATALGALLVLLKPVVVGPAFLEEVKQEKKKKIK